MVGFVASMFVMLHRFDPPFLKYQSLARHVPNKKPLRVPGDVFIY